MLTRVRYSYLAQQFDAAAIDEILERMRGVVESGAFTLGPAVAEFESQFAGLIGVRHAIGVGSGTDALKLGLRALNVGHGDEVITAANTFVASVGAIAEPGAVPVFVDCDDSFCMDVALVERAITPRTKAILPVHFTGETVSMKPLTAIAERHRLPLIEDACQAILAESDGKRAGTWGTVAGFSLHPLKNLNVWGDAGVVVTADDALAAKLRLLRNHGLCGRDEVEILGYNSRLDSVQAVVGSWLIGQTHEITARRIEHAAYYDAAFDAIAGVRVPPRRPGSRRVFHLYMVFAERRDDLYAYCQEHGIKAKIHYPIPIYRQRALRHLGHAEGDFPVADRHAREVISFPVDQHISRAEQDYVVEIVRKFYAR
ncbi:MAG: DegT/DnrJ/EryC1/StrS family aminotransferase [Candidatus Eremiobacteraeota bacterium]|nr:DegT/DnrJ/EryC1/StrS family aminotransferase [Candidatus Eremiobacteraeota bacterium]